MKRVLFGLALVVSFTVAFASTPAPSGTSAPASASTSVGVLASPATPATSDVITDAVKILLYPQPGKTTAAQAVATLGKPVHEDHNADGRFVYLYNYDLSDRKNPQRPHLKGMLALLFSATGTLERKLYYKTNQP